MKLISPKDSHDPSFSSVIENLFSGFQEVAKSEISLIRAEVAENSKKVGKNVAYSIACGVIVLIGVLPFVAFLVIGLGRMMNENYWLSSLLVSLVLTAVGGAVGYRFVKNLIDQDFSLPHTRSSLEEEGQLLKEKAQEISDVIKRRAS